MFNCINLFLKVINAIICLTKSVIGSVLGIIRNFFGLLKGCIDVIYKVIFIIFFCVIAYICYIVFSSATNINKKLDDIKESISYIEDVSENISKAVQVIKLSTTMRDAEKKIAKVGKEAGKLGKKIKQFM